MATLVGVIEASETARERTKVMLLTLCGQWSVREGFERLGMKRTRFQDLRRRMLQAAVCALEEGAAGRPRHRASESKRALPADVASLHHELELTRTQVDIFDCGLGAVPRVRNALRLARSVPGRTR